MCITLTLCYRQVHILARLARQLEHHQPHIQVLPQHQTLTDQSRSRGFREQLRVSISPQQVKAGNLLLGAHFGGKNVILATLKFWNVFILTLPPLFNGYICLWSHVVILEDVVHSAAVSFSHVVDRYNWITFYNPIWGLCKWNQSTTIPHFSLTFYSVDELFMSIKMTHYAVYKMFKSILHCNNFVYFVYVVHLWHFAHSTLILTNVWIHGIYVCWYICMHVV